jgi:hypothetical protein
MPQVAIVARPILAAALVLLALSPMVRPPVQDARQQAALAAALLTGAQLLLGYWFYSYLTWFYPLLIIAIIKPGPTTKRPARQRTVPQAPATTSPAFRRRWPRTAAPDSPVCPPPQSAGPCARPTPHS